MTYTGEVRVGGPSDARDIDGLTVTKIAVGPMDNNAYLLRCASTGQA
ncbi:MAG TPA: MBL fold metallo-hydrolase, partial [Streptosporangiaceae bacterium]|nr:MBL fold metallo-hydrolase [Streptosporangiaceae bacterium]